MSNYEFFCPKCGTRNDIEQRRTNRHTTDFGWRIYETRYVCPNKRFLLDGHTRTGWEGRGVNPKYEAGE